VTGYHYICAPYGIKDADVLEKLIVSLVMILRSGCLLAYNFQVELKHSCNIRIRIVILYMEKVRQHYGH
jgi:hypothetical protein